MTPKKSSDDDLIVEVEESATPEADVAPEIQEPDEKKSDEPKKSDEDVEALRKQLNDLQQAQDGYRLREREAQLAAQRAAQEVQSFRHSAELSQYDTIVTAMGAAEIEVDTAKRDIVLCGQAQDYEGLAHAQERLTAAKTRMVQLESAKDNYERAMQQASQQQQALRQPTEEEYVRSFIENNPNLSWEERMWLKDHPEAVANTKQNSRLNAAYFDAMDKGMKRGSKEYFQFIEERLGYRAPEPVEAKEEEESPAMVAAPPSRTSGAGKDKDTRFTMTKEEAEIAKAAGITPAEYVKQREHLKELKKQGMYNAQG